MAVASAAVPKELHGRVTDGESGEPLPGAILQALNSASRPLIFTSTDTDGRFTLKLREGVVAVLIRCLGYQDSVLDPKADFSSVALSPSATQLRDVIVKAPDIYAKGDTLVFNVDHYSRAGDNAIIDIIKRLPGINVDDDGTIKYQGKPINKFYIDGNDFIGGDYGLATENISHKDVKSVEVMENHQAIKALEGIEFPEEAGINLKLKEDARGRWIGLVQAGGGEDPILYDMAFYAMRMASKLQNICSLKSGNTGWNPASQMTDHSYDDMFSSRTFAQNNWPEYISAENMSNPLAELRTRDNNSLLAASVSSWSRGETSMRLKLNYMSDKLKFNRDVTTDYLNPEIPEFIEDNALTTRKHDFSVEFHAQINRRSYYLKNRFTLKGLWDKANSAVGESLDVSQRINRRNLSAKNDLRLIRRNERGVFSLTSRNTLFHAPDHLAVTGYTNADQTIATTDVHSLTEGEKGWFFGRWKVYLISDLGINYRVLHPSLSGFGPQYDNDGDYKIFLSGLTAESRLDYDRGNWRLSLSAPVKWHYYSVNGSHNFVEFTPSLSIRRQLTAKSELSASFSYRLTPPAPHLFVDVPVMGDYRNIFIARSVNRHSQSSGIKLSYRYRNPLKSLFTNISAGFNRHESPLMTNNIFEDAIIISTFMRHPSVNNLWSFNGGISKGLCHGRIVVGSEAGFNHNSATSMRNSTAYPYRQEVVEVKPYFKGSPAKWLALNYDLRYHHYALKIKGGENSGFHSSMQTFTATVTPTDKIVFNVGAEYYMTHFAEGGNAGLWLLDSSILWQFTSRLRFSLTVRNLLNRSVYSYSTYGTLSNSEYSYRIRPRNILFTVQYKI